MWTQDTWIPVECCMRTVLSCISPATTVVMAECNRERDRQGVSEVVSGGGGCLGQVNMKEVTCTIS